MKTTFGNGKYIIKVEWKGEKNSIWGKDNDMERHHVIYIKNTVTGKRMKVDYWASMMHPTVDDDYGVANALECLVSDVQFYEDCKDIDEFAREMGGGLKPSLLIRTYKALKVEHHNFYQVFDDKSDRDAFIEKYSNI